MASTIEMYHQVLFKLEALNLDDDHRALSPAFSSPLPDSLPGDEMSNPTTPPGGGAGPGAPAPAPDPHTP